MKSYKTSNDSQVSEVYPRLYTYEQARIIDKQNQSQVSGNKLSWWENANTGAIIFFNHKYDKNNE